MPNYTKTVYKRADLQPNRFHNMKGTLSSMHGRASTAYANNNEKNVGGRRRRSTLSPRKLALPNFCLNKDIDTSALVSNRHQICSIWMIKCYSLVSSSDNSSSFASMKIDDLQKAKQIIAELDEASGFEYEGQHLSDLMLDSKLQNLIANLAFPDKYVLYDEFNYANPCYMRIVEKGERNCHLKDKCKAFKESICNGILHMKEHRSVSYSDFNNNRAVNLTVLYPRFECKKNIARELRPQSGLVIALRPKEIACGVFVITFRLLAQLLKEFRLDTVDNLGEVSERFNIRKCVVNDCYRIWRFVNEYHKLTKQ